MEKIEKLNPKYIKNLVEVALNEDVNTSDITTRNLLPPTQRIAAKIIAGETGVVCGLTVAKEVFKALDRKCVWRSKFKDGKRIKKGQAVAVVEGFARALLTGERTAVNFLSHLSGIATLTRKFADRARNSRVGIYDTRKTLPGLRMMEKYAVRCGGGVNNRSSLDEMVIVKDNHIKACIKLGLPIEQVVKSLFTKVPRGTEIEFEAENIREVALAIQCDVDTIMLDNMPYRTMQRAVKLIRKSKKDVRIEVSGKMNLGIIKKILRLDIDKVSIGSITHSAPAIDFSMEISG